jgi:hypothetical protein
LHPTPEVVANNSTAVQEEIAYNDTPTGNTTDVAAATGTPYTVREADAPGWHLNTSTAKTSAGISADLLLIGLVIACAAYVCFMAYSMIRK